MKFDESEKKGRLKEERLLQLEMNAGKTEEALVTTVNTLNQGFEAELTKANQQVASLAVRLDEYEMAMGSLTEKLSRSLVSTVSAQVTDDLQRSIMPQIDQQIKKYVD